LLCVSIPKDDKYGGQLILRLGSMNCLQLQGPL
jgi:hypothetical protein